MPFVSNYRARVFAVIADYESQDFVIGKRDCCLFASDIIQAMTNHDPASEWRGKYRTYSGGLRLLKKAGYTNQVEWLEKNCVEKPVAFGSFGDLAVIQTDEFEGTNYSIGVVGGSEIIFLGQNGLVRLPLTSAQKVFQIGEIE